MSSHKPRFHRRQQVMVKSQTSSHTAGYHIRTQLPFKSVQSSQGSVSIGAGACFTVSSRQVCILLDLHYTLLYSTCDCTGRAIPYDVTTLKLDEFLQMRPGALNLLQFLLDEQQRGSCQLSRFLFTLDVATHDARCSPHVAKHRF